MQSLFWLCLSTLLTIAGFAGAQPAEITVMKEQGLSEGVVGIITSLVYAGVLCMAPFQPWLAARYGTVLIYQAGKLLAACGFASLALAHVPWVWALATLVIGMGAGLTWPVTDSLLATFAPEDKKGAWMGLFQTGMGAAFAVGPFVASALGPQTMFYLAAATSVASSLPLIGRKAEVAHEDDTGATDGLLEVLRMAPELPLLAFIGGFFENSTHTAITLSALGLSWAENAAIALAGVIGAGAFVIQYPIGRLADKRGPRLVIIGALGILIASSLPLPLGRAVPELLWVIAFLWGAAGGCLYTMAMTGMAQRFTGMRVLTATTLMVMSYTVGGLVGPTAGGFAVQNSILWGPLVLFIVTALLGLLTQVRSAATASASLAQVEKDND